MKLDMGEKRKTKKKDFLGPLPATLMTLKKRMMNRGVNVYLQSTKPPTIILN